MAKESRKELKGHFNIHDIPTEENFASLIDSFHHKDDGEIIKSIKSENGSTTLQFTSDQSFEIQGPIFKDRVGIGNFNPDCRLHISGNQSDPVDHFRIDGSSKYIAQTIFNKNHSGSSLVRLYGRNGKVETQIEAARGGGDSGNIQKNFHAEVNS